MIWWIVKNLERGGGEAKIKKSECSTAQSIQKYDFFTAQQNRKSECGKAQFSFLAPQ